LLKIEVAPCTLDNNYNSFRSKKKLWTQGKIGSN